MYLNKRMSILEISKKLGIGCSGISSLLQRDNIKTNLNRFKSVDKEKIKQKYKELMEMKIGKMKIYEILSKEFNLSSGYLSKLRLQ
jgi:transposase